MFNMQMKETFYASNLGESVERLTKRNENGVAVLNIKCPEGFEHSTWRMEEGDQCQHQCEGDIIEKLAQYEELEEQDRLIKLPCKVGDIIWDNDYGVPTAYEITGYSFGESDGYIEYPASKTEIVFYFSNTSGSITGSFALSEIGKTVFLSLEDADKALNESK